jgi:hypothetical protein
LPGPGNTRLFDIVYPFSTPFLYNPADGNLCLDVQTSGGSGEELRWDAVTAPPAIRTIAANSSNAVSGTFSDIISVHQLTFAAPAFVTIRTSQTEVCWNSQSNVTYQVQFRSTLTANLWANLGDCIRATNSTTCVTDPVLVGAPQRFYQVVLTNCVP